jgi:hypothetical protein
MGAWRTGADHEDSPRDCPDDLDVRIAVRAQSPAGESVWLLHEAIVPNGATVFGDGEAGWKKLSRQAAVELGAKAKTDPVWVYVSDNVPPCRMTVQGHWAVQSPDKQPWVRVAEELAGECPIPQTQRQVLALQQSSPPNECLMASSQTLGGSSEPATQTEGLTFPEPFLSAMEPSTCLTPACRLDWHLAGTHSAAGFSVLELTVSRAVSELDKTDQSWSITDYYSLFIKAGPSDPIRSWPDVAGYRGVFYDRRGIRVLLTDEAGVVDTYGPPDDVESPPEHLSATRWRVPGPEEYILHSLWPTRRP